MLVKSKNGICYELNKFNNTATVVHSPSAKGNIFIPRSINLESVEYIVTCIYEGSFNNNYKIQSINFPIDSELSLIDEKAFTDSSLQSIFIPSSVKELREGWCDGTSRLNQIIISPNNNRYKYLDDKQKIVVGKSDPENECYDTLVFGCREYIINQLIIPSDIKHIDASAFAGCLFNDIEFTKDSELVSIGDCAFSLIGIEMISIPDHVKKIGKSAFCGCPNLLLIEFTENSELQLIDDTAFSLTPIENILIPSHVQRIGEKAFFGCKNLNQIFFRENCELNSIDEKAFSFSSLKSITIPPTVNSIGDYAFYLCDSIKNVEFPENSILYSFSKGLFFNSKIERINIPPSIEDLKDIWCSFTPILNEINLSPKNPLFQYLDDEKKVIVHRKSSLDEVFDEIVFASRDIDHIAVPSFIRTIGTSSFSCCRSIDSITFSEDSQLTYIEKEAFSGSSLSGISIPPHVRRIGENSFFCCKKLKNCFFSDDSELEVIGKKAFSDSVIQSISIPSSVREIYESAFQNCVELKTTEIVGEGILLEKSCFDNCHSLLLCSCPNAGIVFLSKRTFSSVSEEFSLFTSCTTNIFVINDN